ncbi:MAG: hypothetical protein RL557_856 [archaeon]|jgi:uncharacterized membrane-anchored protein YhcB (DUF1043 family)
MAVLEIISQMKGNGTPTAQIIQSLKEQGYSPKEINEALSQSEIKSELIRTNQVSPQQDIPQQFEPGELQPSIESQAQMPPSEPAQEQQYPEYNPQQYPQQEQEQYQQPMPVQYPEYQSPQSIDYETIGDLATQIIDEKMKDMKKELSLATKFRKNMTEKINEIENNLQKLENTLNELQMALIRKMGSYGEHVETIANELKATQNSFSKMINPIMNRRDNEQTDKKNKIQEKEIAQEKNESPERSTNQKKDNFEDYVR